MLKHIHYFVSIWWMRVNRSFSLGVLHSWALLWGMGVGIRMARLMFSITVFIIPSHFAQRLRLGWALATSLALPWRQLRQRLSWSRWPSLCFCPFWLLIASVSVSMVSFQFGVWVGVWVGVYWAILGTEGRETRSVDNGARRAPKTTSQTRSLSKETLVDDTDRGQASDDT